MEDSGHAVAGLNGAIRGNATDRIAGSDNLSALNSAACVIRRETLRPAISTASRIHFRRAAEFGEIADEGFGTECVAMERS